MKWLIIRVTKVPLVKRQVARGEQEIFSVLCRKRTMNVTWPMCLKCSCPRTRWGRAGWPACAPHGTWNRGYARTSSAQASNFSRRRVEWEASVSHSVKIVMPQLSTFITY